MTFLSPLARLWWVSLGIKLIVATLIPLFADEAYYWIWSQNLQLSYFDHPPAVAWLASLGNVFYPLREAVRWPTVVLGHGVILIWVQILRPYLSSEKIRWWVYLALLSPLTGWGTILLTPDVALLFFWSLALYATLKALETGENRFYWLVGMSLGLGFCSKYHIVLFVPFLVTWLTHARLWPRVRWRGVLYVLIAGFAFSLPVVIWNWQNDWISFVFQLKHGLEPKAWRPKWPVEYSLGQFLLLFPPFIYLVWKARLPRQLLWLGHFSLGPLIFFFATSFKGPVEANWPAPIYLTWFAWVVFSTQKKRWIVVHSVFWLSLWSVVISEIVFSWIPAKEAISRLHETRSLQPLIRVADSYPNVYATSYQTASLLSFYSGKPIHKLKGLNRRDFFDRLLESQPKGDFFLIAPRDGSVENWLKEHPYKIEKAFPVTSKYQLFEMSQ